MHPEVSNNNPEVSNNNNDDDGSSLRHENRICVATEYDNAETLPRASSQLVLEHTHREFKSRLPPVAPVAPVERQPITLSGRTKFVLVFLLHLISGFLLELVLVCRLFFFRVPDR